MASSGELAELAAVEAESAAMTSHCILTKLAACSTRAACIDQMTAQRAACEIAKSTTRILGFGGTSSAANIPATAEVANYKSVRLTAGVHLPRGHYSATSTGSAVHLSHQPWASSSEVEASSGIPLEVSVAAAVSQSWTKGEPDCTTWSST